MGMRMGERGGDGGGGIVRTPTFSSRGRDWSITHATPPSRTRHSRRDPLPPPFLTSHPPPRTNFGHSPPFNSVSLNGGNGDTSVAWMTLHLYDQGRQTVTAVVLVTDRDKRQHRQYVPRRCRHRQAGRSLLPFVSVTSASCTSTRVNEMGGRGASQFCLASRSKQTHSTTPIRSPRSLPISPAQSRVMVTNKEKTSLDGFISHRRAGPHRLGAVLGDARHFKVETMSF